MWWLVHKQSLGYLARWELGCSTSLEKRRFLFGCETWCCLWNCVQLPGSMLGKVMSLISRSATAPRSFYRLPLWFPDANAVLELNTTGDRLMSGKHSGTAEMRRRQWLDHLAATYAKCFLVFSVLEILWFAFVHLNSHRRIVALFKEHMKPTKWDRKLSSRHKFLQMCS